MVVENVGAIIKDIKVTKKGISLNLEGVNLKGEELQRLASLIGEYVEVSVETLQASLEFDEEEAEQADPEVSNEPTELVEVLQESDGVVTVAELEAKPFLFTPESNDSEYTADAILAELNAEVTAETSV